MTITVSGPDGTTVDFPDGTDAATIDGVMKKNFPTKSESSPVTANKAVRSLATGVPVVGGMLNQANAATNAALAPVLNPLFDEKDQLKGSFSERRAQSLRQQNEMDRRMEEDHPIVDTALKMAGGVAGTLPLMTAAPAAFGLTGPLSQMVTRGAASNAALSAADAAVRGEDVVRSAEIGGAVGAAAPLVGRAVGKGVQAFRDYRNPPALTRQTTEHVGGVDVPLTRGQATLDPQQQAEEEIMRRGGRGSSAEAVAQQADEEARQAIDQARGGIAASLDPTGASARTAPQAAGELVSTDLAARQQAEQAAAAARASQARAEGDALSRGIGGGAAPVTPFDAAESTGAAVARAREAAINKTRAAYQARDAVAGEFDPAVPKGMAEDIRARLNSGDNPIWVDPTNESTANKALKLIDQTLGADSGLLRNAVTAKPAPAPAAAGAVADDTVAQLRAKFGDQVADAYAKQTAAKAAPVAASTATEAGPKTQSLLEFLASKGGLGPDAELEAIGGHSHTVNVEGVGRRKLVRQGGWPLDYAREAAEEAGYLQGNHAGTSTVNDLLDAVDAEMRGRKVYPQGREGHVDRRTATAMSERERADFERVNQGHHDDLHAAGYGDLGPEVRDRAVKLMREQGHGPDEAVDHALMSMEQEDAARAGASGFPKTEARASDFPGDRPAGAAAPERPVDLKTMDEARKRLVTMFGDAKSAAIRTGDKSDMRAMAKILNEFDNTIEEALQSGKFSGDAELASRLQREARASHAQYRQTFSSRGPGDEIGRAVEKILGRYTDSAATPDEVLAMSYGPRAEPGGGKAAKIALRLRDILGENSPDWARYKQGLFSYLTEAGPGEAQRTPAQVADRIERFLGGKGNSLARVALSSTERGQLAKHAGTLRALEQPRGMGAIKDDQLRKAVARIAGADGQTPASSGEIVDMLFSRSGKGDKGISVKLGAYLKQNLAPENWTAVRQGLWEKITSAGEGKTEWGPQMLHQRLHEFLNESGKPLSKIMFTSAERAEMAKLASVYRRMAPLKGTTNPSGTAPMLAKIAKKASNNILALIGLGAHGITGALAGHVIQRGADTIKDARAGKAAIRAFYGDQPRAVAPTSRLPMFLAPGVPAAQR